MKNSLKFLLKEMVPVILGILIALLISNWKENYDDRKFVDRVLSSVTKELEENKLYLDTSIMKHTQLKDTIMYYAEEEDVSILDIISKVNGFGAPNIKNASWSAFLNQKIELVDFEIISILSDLEEDKGNMKVSISKMMDFIYGHVHDTDYENKALFGIAIGDFIFIENELLDNHKKYLQLVK